MGGWGNMRGRLAALVLILLLLAHAGYAEDGVLVDVNPGWTVDQAGEPHAGSQVVLLYRVQFVDYNGTIFQEQVVPEGSPILQPEKKPLRVGYRFLYWYTETGHGEAPIPFPFGTLATRDVRLMAMYTKIPEKKGAGGIAFVPMGQAALEASGFSQIIQKEMDGSITIEKQLEELGEAGSKDAAQHQTLPPPLEGCSIRVFSAHPPNIADGDVIRLWSELTGFEGREIHLQWQYRIGSEWHDAEGANSAEYSFIASNETVNYDWRLVARLPAS